ncbi:MAG: class I SAM-dependent methyltransferase [Candidatus Omnitrophica bacterium]|nr:class I SAM-dependent methyltransferase [Candidatus Omnitrophota bacterium]
MNFEFLLGKNLIPDFLIRFGIRRMLANKLRLESAGGPREIEKRFQTYLAELRRSPIAILTDKANEQHYELPPAFFRAVLGKHLKYSSGYWRDLKCPLPPRGQAEFDASEEAMLELYAQRSDLKDGQAILDLGCGWGSFSLWAAKKFPNSKITGISNSAPQRLFIEHEAKLRGLTNLHIVTSNMNTFDTPDRFDRILSVEMLEHMRNYGPLFKKISDWMKEDACFFVHIFAHRTLAYPFIDEGSGSWMARYFFSGGQMPSRDLFSFFQEDLKLCQQWTVNGKHYQKTCEAWLKKMDAAQEHIMPLFEETYGLRNALRWWVYWRVFFMACAELFGFRGGTEWAVEHYLFTKKSSAVRDQT